VENQEPVAVPPPALQDPPTDKKPPAGPASIRSAAMLSVQPIQPKTVRSTPAEPEAVVAAPSRSQAAIEEAEVAAPSRSQAAIEEAEVASAPPGNNMRSRLQRLAVQRNYWDNDGTITS